MPKPRLSTKRLQVDRANVIIVSVVAVACFVVVFSLVASKTLLDQLSYQNRVIDKKEVAKRELIASADARDKLVEQYKSFVGSESNIIGGFANGTSDRDGDNAKIVLDALPSKYDYPALATSLEKLMLGSNLEISSIGGTDDELNQSAQTGTPTPVDIPFTLSFNGDTDATQDFLGVLQRSIRPIQIQQITFSGSEGRLATTITAKTYYQPEKTFQVKKEVVK